MSVSADEATLQDRVKALEEWKAEVQELLKRDGAKKVDVVEDSGAEQKGEEQEEVTSSDQVGEDADLSYTVEASVWSAGLFMGLPALGWGSSIVLLMLTVGNILGQLIFILATFYTKGQFIQNGPPDQADMERWRFTEGHALANVFSGASLTQRVCGGDDSLSVASAQKDLVDDAAAYQGDIQLIPGVSYGVILTIFVIMLWFLAMCKELHLVIESVAAVSTIPRDRRTVIARSGDKIAFKSISRPRFACVLFLSLVRLSAASVLLIAGCMWLANTTVLEDLVLNGAALAFVLELDELLFENLAPHRLKIIMGQIEDLKLPNVKATRVAKGIGAKSIGTLFLGIVLIVTVNQAYILKTQDALTELNATLCDNNTKFAYSVHPILQKVLVASTVATYNWSAPHLDEASVIQKVRSTEAKVWSQLKDDEDNPTDFEWYEDLSTMIYWSTQTVEAYYIDRACVDNETESAQYASQLKVLTKNTSVASCSDAQQYCDNVGMDMIRALCPNACRCNSLLNGPLNRHGCLNSCKVALDYQIELASIQCRDLPISEILSTQTGPKLADIMGDIDDCSNVSPEMCLPPDEMVYGTYLYLCPISCGCAGADKKPAPWCPPQCDDWTN